MHVSDTTLKELLIESSIIDEKKYVIAQEEAVRIGQSVINVLIGRGELTEDFLAEILEPYFGAPVVDLRKKTMSPEVLELISEAFAKLKGVILFDLDLEKKEASLAMLDPFDLETVEFLRVKLGVWINVFLITQSSFKFALKLYKKKIGVEFNEIITENVKKFLSATGETNLAKLAEAVPIVTILDSIIEHAVALNASDIHFEPFAQQIVIRFRIDGILHEILSLHKAIESILVARIKILASLQIDEHRVPQDGRFHIEIDDGSVIDVRVNVMPVMHGEKAEMRLLKSSARPLTLEDLGLSKTNTEIVIREASKPHGMILVTGPTGHGKTTTLYAMLNILNRPEVNITTIEDPIEYEMPRINQTQVNTKAGITFANGLRALLRQNPDIIMIGEIRDSDTVDISIRAALTGHLLLSTLHTNDAPSAIPRLTDMGAQRFLLTSTMNLVMAQRLVRKICTGCIVSYKMPKEVKNLLVAHGFVDKSATKQLPQTLYRGKGCKVCNDSGYQGQTGIFELFIISEPIRKMIVEDRSMDDIRAYAIQEGMVPILQDGISKVEQGITTIEEVLRVTRE